MTTPFYCTTATRTTPQRRSRIDPSNATLAKTRNNVLLASTTQEFIIALDDLQYTSSILGHSHSHKSSSNSRGCNTKVKIRRNALDLINHPFFIDDEDSEEQGNALGCSDCGLILDSTFSTSSESFLSSSLGPLLLPRKYDCDGSISLFDSKAIIRETSCCARHPHVLGEMERTSNNSDHGGDDDLSTANTTVNSSSSSTDNCLPRSFYARLLKPTSQSSLIMLRPLSCPLSRPRQSHLLPQDDTKSSGWMRRIQQSHDESHREKDNNHSRTSKNSTTTNGRSADSKGQPSRSTSILRGNDNNQSENFVCTLLSRTSWEIQKMQQYNEKQSRKSKRTDMLRRMRKNFFSGRGRLVLPKNNSSNSLFDNILPHSDDGDDGDDGDDDDYNTDFNEEKDFEETMRARTMILQILQRREKSNLLNSMPNSSLLVPN